MSDFKKIDILAEYPWLKKDKNPEFWTKNDVYSLRDEALVCFHKYPGATSAYVLFPGDCQQFLDDYISINDGIGESICEVADVRGDLEDYIEEYIDSNDIEVSVPYWAEEGEPLYNFLDDETYKEAENEFFKEWLKDPENAVMIMTLFLSTDPDGALELGKNNKGEVCLLDPARRFCAENWDESFTEDDLDKIQTIAERVLSSGKENVYQDTDSEVDEITLSEKGELTEYNDFAIYVNRLCSRGHQRGYVIRPQDDGRLELTECFIAKIITRQDFDTDAEYDKAVDEMIKKANGVTGEFITDDVIAYVEVIERPVKPLFVDRVNFCNSSLTFPMHNIDVKPDI